jgi:hypothetical protein
MTKVVQGVMRWVRINDTNLNNTDGNSVFQRTSYKWKRVACVVLQTVTNVSEGTCGMVAEVALKRW